MAGGHALARGVDTPARQGSIREFSITARRYAFDPSRIEVAQGDIVKITFIAEDIPHSFTIDEYRISKRATPGHPVTFEFSADRAGTFVFYCNLTADPRCREMRGELVVRAAGGSVASPRTPR
jgi:cytochrome c oxidase subunit 2